MNRILKGDAKKHRLYITGARTLFSIWLKKIEGHKLKDLDLIKFRIVNEKMAKKLVNDVN